MTPAEADLMRMRDLTKMSGALTRQQIAQLKMWPRIILCADNAEVEFDPESHSVSANIWDINSAAMLEGTSEDAATIFGRRLEKFDEAVKWLLGDEYTVNVSIKGKHITSFPPKTIDTKAHPPKEG